MPKTKKGKRCVGKGSSFERLICKQLGMWWTGGARDDIFWRTSNSGGRATSRGALSTFGQEGDVQATDPIGQVLMDVISFELKCGYPKVSILDCFEDTYPKNGLFTWIQQAHKSCDASGALHWSLIWKRNRRQPLMIIPAELSVKLMWGRLERGIRNTMFFSVYRKISFCQCAKAGAHTMTIMRFSDFLKWNTPDTIRTIAEGKSL